MLQFLTGIFGSFAKALIWFVTAVIVPVTIWFTVLRIDLITLKDSQAQAGIRMESLESRMRINENTLADKLEDISHSLGRIEGELKRIK